MLNATSIGYLLAFYFGMWALGYSMAKGVAYVRKIVALA